MTPRSDTHRPLPAILWAFEPAHVAQVVPEQHRRRHLHLTATRHSPCPALMPTKGLGVDLTFEHSYLRARPLRRLTRAHQPRANHRVVVATVPVHATHAPAHWPSAAAVGWSSGESGWHTTAPAGCYGRWAPSCSQPLKLALHMHWWFPAGLCLLARRAPRRPREPHSKRARHPQHRPLSLRLSLARLAAFVHLPRLACGSICLGLGGQGCQRRHTT